MHLKAFVSGLAAVAVSISCLFCRSTAAASASNVDATTLVMTNGQIKTSSGWATAVAIRDGIIVAVGDSKQVEPFRDPLSKVVDLQGATVLPGLHDDHVHPLFAGLSEFECRVPQGSSLAQTKMLVKNCAEKSQAGAWVVGGQWDAPALGGVPDRAMLDQVAPNNPVLLDDTSGHSAWVNSRALAIAGVGRTTPDPVGGIIERDSSGQPTGVLRENSAIVLVRQHVPRPDAQHVRSALRWSLNKMLSYGITSYTEASVGFAAGPEAELDAYRALADAGILKQRVTLCLTWAPGNKQAESTIAGRNSLARDRISPNCVKIFLDGVPTDGHTAAMLEPYVDAKQGGHNDASRNGILLVDQKVLNEAVTRFDRMGLTVKFHAAGDAAVRAGLNAIEAARKANGFSGQLHNVGYCTFVSKEDIGRARAIGATFEVSPYLWAPSPIDDSITAAVGEDLIKRVWPVRELIDSGALVVPGSDWSVVPSVNPWIGIETLVTREVPGGSRKSFGKAEAISLNEAMDLFTVNAAKHERVADKVGRIEVGMLADLIVLDQNPYDVPITRVHDTKVKMTFIAGEKVYSEASPATSPSR